MHRNFRLPIETPLPGTGRNKQQQKIRKEKEGEITQISHVVTVSSSRRC
jgi:hypothetical protein